MRRRVGQLNAPAGGRLRSAWLLAIFRRKLCVAILCSLSGAQPIGATEITFDIGDKAIECLGPR
jgi:hypothetical protein